MQLDRKSGMLQLKPLLQEISQYLDPAQIRLIEQAYSFAEQAHQGQKRRSGEPYVTHPIAVSQILASLRLDAESIIAALLHDVLEDTGTTKEQIIQLFGAQVAELVDGVSKLTQIKFGNRLEAQAENFRKMVLAMARDIRVILIKLSDRLHNMRTLDALDQTRRTRIARETLEIYAPIAHRLGMHQFRIELEDLGFKALYPFRHRVLQKAVESARHNQRKHISFIEKAIINHLKQAKVPVQKVWARERNLYSIYKKMCVNRVPVLQIIDINAFRIIVDDADSCYRVLGVVHNLYKPVTDRFRDFIAIPKINGYQSLHTTLFGPFGTPIEVQIRSIAMDRIDEHGIVSHWIYKTSQSNKDDPQQRAKQWLKGLLEMQENTGNSLEFIENVKTDLFLDEVYVFTPKGAIMELPKGATAVDFAYALHSDIGSSCIAAKIDRQVTPLSTVLRSGQTVEIITSETARPNAAWLNFVVTGKARGNIRHYLKKQRREESIALGKRMLESVLGIPLKKIPAANVELVLKQHQFKTLDDLYENIGLGNQIAFVIAEQLRSGNILELPINTMLPVAIKGSEGMVVQFAECCKPIPGDDIRGVLQTGHGLTIHEAQCRNLKQLLMDQYRTIDVCWEEKVTGEFKVDLQVELTNQRGTLAILATAISNADANIENITVEQRIHDYYVVSLTISVKDRAHLARVLRKTRAPKAILKVMRRKNDA